MAGKAFVLWACMAVTALSPLGCDDVGDDAALPAEDSGVTPLVDGTVSPVDDDAGTAPDDGSLADATIAGDATVADMDSGQSDEASVMDASDATDRIDATKAVGGDGGDDASVADAEPGDAGAPYSGGPDAAVDATAPMDAGSDAGSGPDASSDAGGALTPCTAPGQSHCVQCQYNNGAAGSLPNVAQVCTPTEAALVAHDIASGLATAPGADPNGGCYQCAAESGCLDDSAFGDSAHECEDLAGPSNASACEATIACILGSSCAYASGEVSSCYCGTAPVSGACAAAGASNSANGPCLSAEAAGLGFAASDGLDILKNFTSTTLPSGVANDVFQCAISNGCNACLH